MQFKVRNLTVLLEIRARLISSSRVLRVSAVSQLLHSEGRATGFLSDCALPTTPRGHYLIKLIAVKVFARVSLTHLLG